MSIANLPKGAVPDSKDTRDYRLVLGAPQVDWLKDFHLPVPPDSDQASADCCVGESWSYYHWQLKLKPFSVRSLFARIALGYGAYIRDGGIRLIKIGQQDFAELPDPNPKTAQNMRSFVGLNDDQAIDDRELDAFVLSNWTIDGVAWAIETYQGVVFGVQGSNEGWQDMQNPRPPTAHEPVWGHALYGMGHHMHDGQKCIIAKSSWCSVVKDHHIKDNYFISGNIFSPWTLISRKGNNMSRVVKEPNGTLRIEFGAGEKTINLGINSLTFASKILESGEPIIELGQPVASKQVGIIESGLIIDEE